MPTHEELRKQLLDLIYQAEAKGQKIVSYGGEVVAFGQHVSDLGFASADVLRNVLPSRTHLEGMTQAWQYVHTQEDQILQAITPVSTAPASTSGYAADFSMTILASTGVVVSVPPDKRSEAQQAVARLSSVIDSQANKDKVLSLFEEYGLNEATPRCESPRDLFQTAYASFERPVAANMSAAASLIPMRECINTVVAELIRRRPTQEKAKSESDKILSICRQCAGSSVTSAAIESMATRWDDLVNELSGAKAKQYSRDQWLDALRRATLFLIELLQSLDRSKMK